MAGGRAFLTSQQAILVGISVAMFHNATGVNVVYSSRGLWAIIMVWLLSRLTGYRAEQPHAKTLLLRLIGAILMVSAILLAILSSPTTATVDPG